MVSPHHGSAAGPVRALVATLGLLGLAASAQGRTETLRWMDPNPAPSPVVGFRVHTGASSGSYDQVIDLELPSPDADGIYSFDLVVPDADSIYVALTAYDITGLESDFSNERLSEPPAAPPTVVAFGEETDRTALGDWDGDGRTDVGVVRDVGGASWFILDGSGGPELVAFGEPADVPLSGDWNGDGVSDVGIARAHGADLLFILDTPGGPEMRFFGEATDIPLIGDWDGDGVSDPGVVRPFGDLMLFILDVPGGPDTILFGTASDEPIAGDWNADGRTDVGVVRRTTSDLLFILQNPDSAEPQVISFGDPELDEPVVGDWNGDGASDIGIARNVGGQLVFVLRVLDAAVTLWVEDFEGLLPNLDPPGWIDTQANNSMELDQSLFATGDVDGTMALMTSSTQPSIHSHYVTPASAGWSGYEYRGRMRIDHPDAGIAVTSHSDYPGTDSYYRLKREAGIGAGDFYLLSHPLARRIACTRDVTGVVPAPFVWYHFRLLVAPESDRTDVRAKVWAEGESEPSIWQIECSDTHPDRFTSGTVGVWSMGDGVKYWDDLRVVTLP